MPDKDKLYDDRTDKFSALEKKKIVDMVIQDIEADRLVQKDWVEKLKRWNDHKHSVRPSILEGTDKRSWQSDRNLGIAPAIADIYQSTFVASTWNPDSIHMVATEKNDIDNKDNLERFAKWMVGKHEVNAQPEVEDFIQNKIDQGFSIFEIYREITYEWVDRHIPIRKFEKGEKVKYKVETVKKKFEKAVLDNIDNLDDILMPRYGDDIQKLPHIIRVLHWYGDTLLAKSDAKQIVKLTAKNVMAMKNVANEVKDDIEKLKADHLDLTDVVDEEFRALPIDVHRWYGWYTKDGRRERYRFYIEEKTRTFLAGKPLRKITKSGKYPLVGGPFEKIVGQLRGDSLYEIIEQPINALNETWNQKSDFQYVENCPHSYHRKGEGYTEGEYLLEPGVSYPTEGNPNEDIYAPNYSRSMAWADSDIRILFEVIEKRTGAATYFQTNERNTSGTATRDQLTAQRAETRFGKWTARIQAELNEALTMCLNIYQEHLPDNLGERVLGEDGKQTFRNLSVETLRYNADARMEEDVIAGSKAYERQVMLWAFGMLSQSIWFNPQINPKGNWLLTKRVMKVQGIAAPEMYLPPEPKPEMGTGRDIDGIWSRLIQGEVVEPEQNWDIPQILTGLYKKKSESYSDLDPEYQPNLDQLIFDTEMAYQQFVKKMMEEQMANRLAQQAIMGGGGQPPGPGGPAASPGPAMTKPDLQPKRMI